MVEYNSVPFFQGTTFRQKRAKTGSFCIPLYQAALMLRGRSLTMINFCKKRKGFCEMSRRYNSGPKINAGFQLSNVKDETSQELRLLRLCEASAVFQVKERDDHN